jgi:hypothetical protein
MRYERKVIDEKKGIIQITTEDERWYSKDVNGKIIYVPSVTWICDHYPKGIAFYKWLANQGWDEAEALKASAAERGSKIHQAVEELMNGKVIKMDSKFVNRDSGTMEELTSSEYEAVMSFVSWFERVKPVVINKEFNVFSDDNGYAGTVDLACKINGEEWIIDFKSGQSIWPSYELQLSAYKHAIMGDFRLGILQLGYRKNKDKFKFTELEDKFDLFLAAKQIWANECTGQQPPQREYPIELKLIIQKEATDGDQL